MPNLFDILEAGRGGRRSILCPRRRKALKHMALQIAPGADVAENELGRTYVDAAAEVCRRG